MYSCCNLTNNLLRRAWSWLLPGYEWPCFLSLIQRAVCLWSKVTVHGSRNALLLLLSVNLLTQVTFHLSWLVWFKYSQGVFEHLKGLGGTCVLCWKRTPFLNLRRLLEQRERHSDEALEYVHKVACFGVSRKIRPESFRKEIHSPAASNSFTTGLYRQPRETEKVCVNPLTYGQWKMIYTCKLLHTVTKTLFELKFKVLKQWSD